MPGDSVLNKLIGKTTKPIEIEVEKGDIRRFATAIGETNPIHLDEAAAKKAGFPTLIAPVSFPAALHDFAEFYETLELNTHALMHAEEEYEYFKPIHAGDRIKIVHTVTNAYDKQAPNGLLVFIVCETRATDARSKSVFKSRRILVELRK